MGNSSYSFYFLDPVVRNPFGNGLEEFAKDHPANISWSITNKCNIRCLQCFNDSGVPHHRELTREAALDLARQMVDMKVQSVTLTGGEPLTRPDVLDIARTLVDGGIRVVINTNGILLTDENVRELKNTGVEGVEVGLDGACARTHDYFRGQGVFDKATAGLRRASQAGLFTIIATTINKKNISELQGFLDMAERIGVDVISLRKLFPIGRGADVRHLALSAEETKIMLKFWYQNQFEKENKVLVFSPEPLRILMSETLLKGATEHDSYVMGGCAAGIGFVSVEADGSVVPCGFAKIVVGNVMAKPLTEIWQNSEVLRKFRVRKVEGKCGNCKYKILCGGCRGYDHTLSLNDSDDRSECVCPLLLDEEFALSESSKQPAVAGRQSK